MKTLMCRVQAVLLAFQTCILSGCFIIRMENEWLKRP